MDSTHQYNSKNPAPSSTLTPLKIFEEQKKQFLLENPVNNEKIDWEPLFKHFQQYANAINTQDLDEQEEYIPLAQLPQLEYEQQCLIEETCTQNRRVEALAYPTRPVPEHLLIIKTKRPASPIFDYYQILLLWREKRYEKVKELCLLLMNHIDQLKSINQQQCTLIPYYYKHDEAFTRKTLHPMMTDFSLSEVYYYLGQANQALNKDATQCLSGCNYFRARACLANDFLKEAQIYAAKSNYAAMASHFKNLNYFLEFLINEVSDSKKDNEEHAKTFVKGNLTFCKKYSDFLKQNKIDRPLFLAVLDTVKKEKKM